MITHLCNAIPFNMIPVAPISAPILHAEDMVEGLRKCKCQIAVILPSIALELVQAPELLEYCSNLEMVLYTGGPLTESTGHLISEKVRLICQYGVAELGAVAQLWDENEFGREDWSYIRFHPGIGYEMRPYDNTGNHDFYIVRNSKHIFAQPAFCISSGEGNECITGNDLFRKHPKKPDLWRWVARKSDLITFITGERFSPVQFEDMVLESSGQVRGALVGAPQSLSTALIIQLHDHQEISDLRGIELLEELWSSIKLANKRCLPPILQVAKDQIYLARPEYAMLRTDRGVVRRAETYKLFLPWIKAPKNYTASVDLAFDPRDPNGFSFTDDEHNLKDWVRGVVLKTMSRLDIGDDHDFFALGMRSSQANLVMRRLRQCLKLPEITLNFVRAYASVNKLTLMLRQYLREDALQKDTAKKNSFSSRESLLYEYAQRIDAVPASTRSLLSATPPAVVLLVGSTGRIGSNVLEVLASKSEVSKVICFSRSESGREEQELRSGAHGLPQDWQSFAHKIEFVKGDLSEESLGLDPEYYNQLALLTHVIIHAAWSLDFNERLQFFKPHLGGLVNLLRFANACVQLNHFLFLSSVDAVLQLRQEDIIAPEGTINVFEEADPAETKYIIPEEIVVANEEADPATGYAESKYVAEHLLLHAAQRLARPVRITIARLNQVAGFAKLPTQHKWPTENEHAFFPRLVLGARRLRSLPNSLCPRYNHIDWVPVDLLARMLVEIALSNWEHSMGPSPTTKRDARSGPGERSSVPDEDAERRKVPTVIHLVNPRPIKWAHAHTVVANELRNWCGPVKSETLREFCMKLAQDARVTPMWSSKVVHGDQKVDVETRAYIKVNPAIKSWRLWKQMGEADALRTRPWEIGIHRGRWLCEEFQRLEAVQDEWLKRWVREIVDEYRRSGAFQTAAWLQMRPREPGEPGQDEEPAERPVLNVWSLIWPPEAVVESSPGQADQVDEQVEAILHESWTEEGGMVQPAAVGMEHPDVVEAEPKDDVELSDAETESAEDVRLLVEAKTLSEADLQDTEEDTGESEGGVEVSACVEDPAEEVREPEEDVRDSGQGLPGSEGILASKDTEGGPGEGVRLPAQVVGGGSEDAEEETGPQVEVVKESGCSSGEDAGSSGDVESSECAEGERAWD